MRPAKGGGESSHAPQRRDVRAYHDRHTLRVGTALLLQLLLQQLHCRQRPRPRHPPRLYRGGGPPQALQSSQRCVGDPAGLEGAEEGAAACGLACLDQPQRAGGRQRGVGGVRLARHVQHRLCLVLPSPVQYHPVHGKKQRRIPHQAQDAFAHSGVPAGGIHQGESKQRVGRPLHQTLRCQPRNHRPPGLPRPAPQPPPRLQVLGHKHALRPGRLPQHRADLPVQGVGGHALKVL
mmetsp:Transcript_92770/g.248111  ORF Transcript_92770/g.248111 Transcript_92770/m.248111 type:complete len:235 (-) Transcript_92770:314-1018(-)